ncbi:MAG: UTP--glucose-1-phosphate uridylyltransferase GalU [Alphaproteobacteria bacterium]|nr:UTP--glucose-1-phosphate uridylyltransferase GalU [Alphaproteobacteria bacterium SS10]
MTRPVRKAVFPVAGLGTRFLPATKVMPKEMLALVDKPLIQYAVEEARAAGVTSFAFVTSQGKTLIEDHFDTHAELYETLERREKAAELEAAKATEITAGDLAIFRQHVPLGLGHAVWCARHFVGDEPFAVILPDDVILGDQPALKQMVEAYADTGGNMVAVEEVPRDQVNRYGILDVDQDDGRLASATGLVEKPDPADAPSNLSIIGRYILQPEIFKMLESHETGAGGEIQLTDAMAKLIGPMPFHGFRFTGTRYDCGTKAGFVAANLAFALAREDLAEDVRRMTSDLLMAEG